MSDNETFTTRNISLASFLHYCGCWLVATRKLNQYSFAFDFGDVEKCRNLERLFYEGQAVVCAKELLDADREVKQPIKWASASPSGEWR